MNSLPIRGTSRMNSRDSLDEDTQVSASDSLSLNTGTDTDKE